MFRFAGAFRNMLDGGMRSDPEEQRSMGSVYYWWTGKTGHHRGNEQEPPRLWSSSEELKMHRSIIRSGNILGWIYSQSCMFWNVLPDQEVHANRKIWMIMFDLLTTRDGVFSWNVSRLCVQCGKSSAGRGRRSESGRRLCHCLFHSTRSRDSLSGR